MNLDNNLVILTLSTFIAASCGATILFGWGFDARPGQMYGILTISATISMILYILTLYGYHNRLALWTVLFMATTSVGYLTLITAHLKEIHQHSILATMSAWVGIISFARIVTELFTRILPFKLSHVIFICFSTMACVFITCSRELTTKY